MKPFLTFAPFLVASVLVNWLIASSAFTVRAPMNVQRRRSPASGSLSFTKLSLVTEDDVIEAVEKAEKLWEEALEARKTANALSDRAEEEAEAAASSAVEADEMMKASKSISLEKIAQADAAAKSNIDANSMVSRALQALEKADELERIAEEALSQSEEKLEQHLKDFPDSTLA